MDLAQNEIIWWAIKGVSSFISLVRDKESS